MRLRDRLFAIALGFLCHAAFACAVAYMAYQLYFGMTQALFPLGGTAGRIINWGLLLQFPILHSALLTSKGTGLMARLAPSAVGRELVSTTFALVASLQLLAVFMFWTPAQSVWLVPHGAAGVIWSAAYGAAWLLLIKALCDAGLATQTGFLGWSAVARGRRPNYGALPQHGLFRLCRQPVYLGFALILFSAPVWNFDHLLICAVWGLYCFAGPLHKEQRYISWYGDKFRAYQERVPYFFPWRENGTKTVCGLFTAAANWSADRLFDR